MIVVSPGISIGRAPQAVFDSVRDPANLSRWTRFPIGRMDVSWPAGDRLGLPREGQGARPPEGGAGRGHRVEPPWLVRVRPTNARVPDRSARGDPDAGAGGEWDAREVRQPERCRRRAEVPRPPLRQDGPQGNPGKPSEAQARPRSWLAVRGSLPERSTDLPHAALAPPGESERSWRSWWLSCSPSIQRLINSPGSRAVWGCHRPAGAFPCR
jgi:hypothetical protein